MATSIESRLLELGIELPPLSKPQASYLSYRRYGDLVYLAGQTSSLEGVPVYTGPMQHAEDVPRGYRAARLCGLNLLSALSAACEGELDRVAGCLKLNGYVFAAPSFDAVPSVVNGASDLITEVFGEIGQHARTAVGVAVLPHLTSVEVEGIFVLKR